MKRRVEEALRMVNLEGYEGASARRLSGGEPTANLDPANAALIEGIIRRIAERGTTVVLATHNLFQARRLSHKVAHLFEGRVVEIGETEELFERTRSELTKSSSRASSPDVVHERFDEMIPSLICPRPYDDLYLLHP